MSYDPILINDSAVHKLDVSSFPSETFMSHNTMANNNTIITQLLNYSQYYDM